MTELNTPDIGREPVPCSACGRNMTDPVHGGSCIGISINVIGADDGLLDASYSEVFQRVYPEVALPLRVDICFVCWIRSLGVSLP